jgi:hypothetical protein
MKEQIKKIETKHYQHIDNGGINVDISSEIALRKKEPSCLYNTSISIDMTYHGYPSISISLDLGSDGDLKAIIDALTEHYYKVQAQLTGDQRP